MCTHRSFKILASAFLILTVGLLAGCNKDDDDGTMDPDDNSGSTKSMLRLQMKPFYGQEAFVVGESYTDVLGHTVNLPTARFYLSNITLIAADGSETMIQDVALFDLDKTEPISPQTPDWDPFIEVEVEAGTYAGIRFDVGVDPSLNKNDPASYENTHPLSVFANMHWDWNTNYIFLKIDGKADSISTDTLTHNFQYHVGLDDYFMKMEPFQKSIVLNAGERTVLDVNIDLQASFVNESDTIRVLDSPGTHTFEDEPLAKRYMENFANAITIP